MDEVGHVLSVWVRVRMIVMQQRIVGSLTESVSRVAVFSKCRKHGEMHVKYTISVNIGYQP